MTKRKRQIGLDTRLDLRPRRMATLVAHWFRYQPVGQFITAIGRLIWRHRVHSLTIFAVTIAQEFAALWPVTLLGDLIDRLGTGDLGNVVWLLLLASLLYPAILRGNVILRHMLFYQTDYQQMVELVLKEADSATQTSATAGAAYTRLANAVAGITNAAYHVLGSFTPIVIKIFIVSGRLLAYSRLLGFVYLGSLVVPAVLTVLANSRMRKLRDANYAIGGEVSGMAMEVMSSREDAGTRDTFTQRMTERRGVLQRLVATSQASIYVREAVLVGSQFAVVFIALAARERIGITPGDFAKILGYTTQVAAEFIAAASTLDSVISFSRAYHVYVTGGRQR